METKPVITIGYVYGDHLYDIAWANLSGMDFCMTEFWDTTMLWCSAVLAKEELVGYYGYLQEYLNGEDLWVEHEVEDEHSMKYRFEFPDFVLMVIPA